MNNLRFDNKLKVTIFIGLLFLLFISAFVFPLWIISYFKFSGIKHIIVDNYIAAILCGFLLSYFIMVGQYYYSIYIDNYVVKVVSYRPVVDILRQRNYVDISHSMLVDYSFFTRYFTFNKTLMLKIKTEKKVIIKRFNLTLITSKEVVVLSRALDKIIQNNK